MEYETRGKRILVTGATGLTGRPPIFTRDEARALMRRATFDVGKADRELGFKASTSLEEGMRHVREWLQNEAYLK